MHRLRLRLLPLPAKKQKQAVVSFSFSIADRGSAVVPFNLIVITPFPQCRSFLENHDSQIRVPIVRVVLFADDNHLLVKCRLGECSDGNRLDLV
jgi:hypothetical protein